jgi:hypothetical protein
MPARDAYLLIPLQYRQFVFPGVFGDQETGLVRGTLFAADCA